MSTVIWTTLVRDHYYIISNNSSFEFGIKFLKDYIVTWALPEFMFDEVSDLSKKPWDLYREMYQGMSPDNVYQLEENLSLTKIHIDFSQKVFDAPEIPLTPVYTVLVRRWGSPEGHTYLVGTSGTREGAIELGKKEEYLRGGKYKAEIYKGYLESESTEILKDE